MFSFLTPKSKPNGLVSLSLHHDGLAFVHMQAEGYIPHIKQCEFIKYSDPSAIEQTLTQAVRKYHLQHMDCTLVLQPDDYQLLLLDAIDVDESELAAAARWHVKDMIDIPFENAAIDAFVLPRHGMNEQHKKMYVVATKIDYLQKLNECIAKTGLELTTIDITELALRNVAVLYEELQRSMALMTLRSERNAILISRAKNLYLARNLDMDLAHLNDVDDSDIKQSLLDDLLLEAQRSYDYCQSELGLSPPEKLMLGPAANLYPDIGAYLGQHLSSKIEVIDINRDLTCDLPLDNITQARCLTAIGGGLGMLLQDEVNHAAS